MTHGPKHATLSAWGHMWPKKCYRDPAAILIWTNKPIRRVMKEGEMKTNPKSPSCFKSASHEAEDPSFRLWRIKQWPFHTRRVKGLYVNPGPEPVHLLSPSKNYSMWFVKWSKKLEHLNARLSSSESRQHSKGRRITGFVLQTPLCSRTLCQGQMKKPPNKPRSYLTEELLENNNWIPTCCIWLQL